MKDLIRTTDIGCLRNQSFLKAQLKMTFGKFKDGNSNHINSK